MAGVLVAIFREKVSCPKQGGRYVNPHLQNSKRTVWEFLKWRLGRYPEPQGNSPAPSSFSYPQRPWPLDKSQPMATWINHTTCLIEVEGIRLLTDPIWSNACSPVQKMGPRRRRSAPIPLEDLPEIHCVLISHNHYDHLDAATVRALHRRYPNLLWIVPTGVEKWFHRRKIYRVVSLDWWGEADLNRLGLPLEVTAVPAQHFSGRTPWDRDKTLWCGFVVRWHQSGKVLYFAGDTGYNDKQFREIGAAFPQIDLSLIPIGVYVPRAFMAPVHIEPKHSVVIHREVGSRLSIGTHWGTFPLSEEPLERPPFDLFLAIEAAGLDPLTFVALPPGGCINW